MRLDCVSGAEFTSSFFLIYFYLLRSTFHVGFCLLVGPVHCALDQLPL